MDKLKALLLPLALIFAAIAVFETGARYGATNMRAYAIASELKVPLSFLAQGHASMDENSKQNLAMIIDHVIATGAMHRKIWYLNKDAKAALDKVLTYALSVRGDGTEKRFEMLESAEDIADFNREKIAEIRQAVHEAKVELVDNAPSVAEQETAEQAAVAAPAE